MFVYGNFIKHLFATIWDRRYIMRNENLTELTQRDSNFSLRGLTYLLIGTGIGAAVALLFAPKSGTQLRGEIADVTRKGYDATLEKAKDLKVQSADVITGVKEKANAVYDFAATQLAKGEDALSDAVTTSKNAISDGISKVHDASAQESTELASNSRYSGRKSTSVM